MPMIEPPDGDWESAICRPAAWVTKKAPERLVDIVWPRRGGSTLSG